jgi:hypothetical protein
MPNLNTAIVSLMSSESTALKMQNYILMFIFFALIFLMFSQRIFNIQSQYYILIVTLIITLLMSFIICSIISVDTKLVNNTYLNFINSIFDNPSSRNFLSIVSLILFVILVYELTEYDNNKPHYFLDKLMFGHNNYISNRTGGIMTIFVFTLLISYTVMTTTKE